MEQKKQGIGEGTSGKNNIKIKAGIFIWNGK
jgi:hypothetical protein